MRHLDSLRSISRSASTSCLQYSLNSFHFSGSAAIRRRTFVRVSSSASSPSISGAAFSFPGTQNRRISAAPMPIFCLSWGRPMASPVAARPAV